MPHEAGLGNFCAFGTGFVGEAALKEHRPERRIVSILFEDPEARPLHDEPIYFEGNVVGQITSAAWSYKYDRSVALAMIDLPSGGSAGQPPRTQAQALPSALLEGEVVPGFDVEIACTRYAAKASLKSAKEAF
jgi:4-methylaminobutanoate oxidase (formaldehyde-forming)